MHSKLFFIVFFLSAFVVNGPAPLRAATKLDASFGLNGRVAVELGAKNSAHAVVVQPDGKIVVAGSSSKGKALNFSLLRFNKDGSLDTFFNGEGAVVTSVVAGDDEALALGLLSDGRIVAAGYSNNGANRDFAMVCYLPDGSLDQTFGNAGVVITAVGSSNEEITAMEINAQDMITVAGAVEGTAGRVLATARYFSDGILDPSYGEQGISLIGVGTDSAAEGIIERADGTIVVSGSYEENKKASLMLIGLTADGLIDASFGEKGVAVPAGTYTASEGYRLAQDNSRRIYLAGAVGLAGKRDTALFRFTDKGKPDTSFGTQGVVVTPVSQEDDVLYDVAVGKSGVVASGFTTDAGTRQFLLTTYSVAGGAEPTGASSPTISTSGVAANGTDAIGAQEIQEVKVVGNTTVQIRKLQVSSSLADQRTTQLLPSGVSLAEEADHLATRSKKEFFKVPLQGLFSLAARLGGFFLPEAMAAESSSRTSETAASTSSSSLSKVVTTTFSEGESVSYALATDANSNVIVVGTADGAAASSIVAARYQADVLAANQAGFTSSYIYTRTPDDVTRTTVVTGGSILPAFGKTVTKRGVVFSVTDTPTYSDSSTNGSSSGSSSDTGPAISSATGTVSGTAIDLTVVTDEDASCKYDTSDTDYSSMASSMVGSSDGLTHTATGLTGVVGDKYYVRCQGTSSGVSSSSSTTITVTTATASSWPQKTRNIFSDLLVKEAIAATTASTDSTTTDSSSASTTTSSSGIFSAASTSTSSSSDTSDFLEEGQTENGAGYGDFSAKLKKLKPGKTYYVRAYAVTAEGVYYGKQLTFTTADACFVATASFGTLLHPGVRILRDFRDGFLNQTRFGEHLVSLYYSVSPPIADFIGRSGVLRLLVRLLLLPFIGFSWLALQAGMVKALLIIVCAATGMARVSRFYQRQ